MHHRLLRDGLLGKGRGLSSIAAWFEPCGHVWKFEPFGFCLSSRAAWFEPFGLVWKFEPFGFCLSSRAAWFEPFGLVWKFEPSALFEGLNAQPNKDVVPNKRSQTSAAKQGRSPKQTKSNRDAVPNKRSQTGT